MNNVKIIGSSAIAICAICFSMASQAHGSSDPILTKVMLNKLEWRQTKEQHYAVLEGETWVGKDLNKLWLKFDGEFAQGETQDAELQALYSHAISPFWDLQLGLRQDIKPSPQQTWGVLGVKGLAPYFFDVNAALFVGESGASAARISLEYELLFTQKLILSPEISLNAYGQNNPAQGQGAGLADTEFGLRLRYEIWREFAPYVGVNWTKKYAQSANYAQASGEATSDNQWVIGLRAWF